MLQTKTPGKTKYVIDTKENLQRLTKLSKQYRSGKIASVDWLDRLTFAEVEQINQREKQSANMVTKKFIFCKKLVPQFCQFFCSFS
jgi:hypothetical protein